MKLLVSTLIVFAFILSACAQTGSPSMPGGLAPSVATGAAQAPTAAAGLGGVIVAAETEAAKALPPAQTAAAKALPPAATQAAGAFSTGAPLAQTSVAAAQTAGAPLAQTAVAAAQTAVSTAIVPLGSITPPASAAAVQVKLTDGKIGMPASMPTGVILFIVNNGGTTEHNFEIQGNGIDKKLDANLKPGETAPLAIQLSPGSYRVFDPVGNNRDTGMSLNLTVTTQ